MNTRWILAAAVSCSALVAPAFAQQADDAKATLAECAKAMKDAKTLTFEGKRSATGMLKDFIDCSGTVKIFRPEGAKAPMVMVTGRIKQPAAADKQLTYMQDGTMARWLEQKDNTLYERPISDQLAVQEFSLTKQILPDDYLAEPFTMMLKYDKLTKMPSDNVKGEVCDIVQGASADGQRTITYSFSVKDHLPRRIEQTTGSGTNAVSMIFEASNINTQASLTAKDFDIALPPGYVVNKQTAAAMPTGATPDAMGGAPVQLGLKTTEPAPNFVFKDSGGSEVSLANMKGKVVVLEFFGSMFKASTIGSIDLNSISSEMKDKVKIVGLACREASEGTAKEYFKTNNLSYTLVPKGDAAVTDYNVKGFPSYYVITPSGKIGAFFQSYPGKDAMVSAINQASAE